MEAFVCAQRENKHPKYRVSLPISNVFCMLALVVDEGRKKEGEFVKSLMRFAGHGNSRRAWQHVKEVHLVFPTSTGHAHTAIAYHPPPQDSGAAARCIAPWPSI